MRAIKINVIIFFNIYEDFLKLKVVRFVIWDVIIKKI